MSLAGAYRELAGKRLASREFAVFSQRSWRADGIAVLAFGAAIAVAAGVLLYDGTLIGQDSATQFYPWYDYLGERLRAGDIPGWNPYQVGGAPFAADPQSGWTYLPAMLFFSVLPLRLAVAFFLVFHLALAGLATFALARRLGIGAGGALVAALAYALSGPLLGRSVCCPAAFEVATWAPVVLLGVALATHRTTWTARVVGWAIAGLALSQVLAAWLGQGSYYVLLTLAAFIAWRTLIAPLDPSVRWSIRVKHAALHCGAILAIGFGLAAASVLPRLDYIARSNVAGGEYAGQNAWAAEIGGVSPGVALDRVLEPTLHNPGSATVTLAILSLLLAYRRRAAPFFIPFGLGALTLATPFRTPLHIAFYMVFPRFEALHQHWPERVSVVGYMAFALLAGATAEALARDTFSPRRALLAAGLPIAALAVLLSVGSSMPLVPTAAILLVAALVAAAGMPRLQPLRWAAPVVLAAVVATDLLWSFQGVTSRAPYGGYHRVDLDTYYAQSGAAEFLREQTSAEPGRYIGFDPVQQAIADGQITLYRFQFASPATSALLVNNLGTLHNVEDAQGYNPVQSQRFVGYLTALNGHPQEYHDANVYPSGLSSPLLDLLNVRYIVIPAATTPDRPDLAALARELPIVYEDAHVRVLDNPLALPRAWVVHSALQVEPDDELSLLASGAVDPRQTALVEAPIPAMAPAIDSTSDQITIVSREPERLEIATRTDAPGLLVLSEVYDPGWKVYVDGEQAQLLVADHLLRSTPLPAGNHVVEFRYEPTSLRVGFAISTATVIVLVSTLVAVGWRAVLRRDHQQV